MVTSAEYTRAVPPWGADRGKLETVPYEYQFNGQRLIASAGVYYYSDGGSYGRFYDPSLARWTQADSVMPRPGDPQAYNRYAYGFNNPVKNTDPNGHCPPDELECSAEPGARPTPAPGEPFDVSPVPPVRPALNCGDVSPVCGAIEILKSPDADWQQRAQAISELGAAGPVFFFGGWIRISQIPLVNRIPGAVQGFGSFDAFKKVFGAAEKGNEWHHIVEQNANNIKRFGPEALHNPQNIIEVPGPIHDMITGFYNSKRAFTGELTVREWLSPKSIQEQYEFGIQQLKRLGVIQ